ncbi:MAG: hypothetical protein LBN01_00735 [Endomicrobium sp.]|jgi:hypothetical protein|nr:hypothetical protein [Endomicrobium sp.]
MKKMLCTLLFSVFCSAIFAVIVFAEQLSGYQSLNQGNFFMCHSEVYVDGAIFPFEGTVLSRGSKGDYDEISYDYFQEFNYGMGGKSTSSLIERAHEQDTFSIYGEDAVFKVKYDGQSDFPQLILTFPNGSTKTHTMSKSSAEDNICICSLRLGKGSYNYKYVTADKRCELSGRWHVTTRPYNFVSKSPSPLNDVLPDNVCFSWSVKSDEKDDLLSYELYLGFEQSESKLPKVDSGPGINSLSFTISKLDSKKQYYWYMIVKNKFGASLKTEIYSFITGGVAEKFYNAPNPFNPARGVKTAFVFPMYQDGTAQIMIYSEYGDKV